MNKIEFNRTVKQELVAIILTLILLPWLGVQGIYWYFDPEVSSAFRFFLGTMFFITDAILGMCILYAIACVFDQANDDETTGKGLIEQLLNPPTAGRKE